MKVDWMQMLLCWATYLISHHICRGCITFNWILRLRHVETWLVIMASEDAYVGTVLDKDQTLYLIIKHTLGCITALRYHFLPVCNFLFSYHKLAAGSTVKGSGKAPIPYTCMRWPAWGTKTIIAPVHTDETSSCQKGEAILVFQVT